jgi:hypothetical protein
MSPENPAAVRECLAKDVTRDAVYHGVCATIAGDASHSIAQFLKGEINDLVESERLCQLGFVVVGGA